MSDLISRADAIRWVKTECNPYGKPTLDYDSGLKFIEHLKKMPSELPSTEAEWIPCSERLPEDCDPVLVTYKWSKTDREVSVGEYWGNPSEFCPEEEKGWGKDGDHVTAWMPLPKPYREDGEA